jgi:hypothetical protein
MSVLVTTTPWMSFSSLGASPWFSSCSLRSEGENLVQRSVGRTVAGSVHLSLLGDVVFKTFSHFLFSFISVLSSCSRERRRRLGGAVHLLVVLVGGCPSSSFPWCHNHPPLEVVGHSGWSFMSNKGRSSGGPSGGTSRGVQSSTCGIGGFFGRAVRPPQALASVASMVEDASPDIG